MARSRRALGHYIWYRLLRILRVEEIRWARSADNLSLRRLFKVLRDIGGSLVRREERRDDDLPLSCSARNMLKCSACGHESTAEPRTLARLCGWDALLEQVAKRLGCSKCEQKNCTMRAFSPRRPRGYTSRSNVARAALPRISCGSIQPLNQRDIKRYLVCFVRARQPSFGAVFERPSYALREEEARRRPR